MKRDFVESEKGAVMLEWAIIAFGAICGMCLFLDIVRGLNTYMLLSHIANEAARNASRVSALEPGMFTDIKSCTAVEQACLVPGTAISATACGLSNPVPVPYPCGQNVIQQRVRYMVNQMHLDVDPNQTVVHTRYLRPTDTAVVSEKNTVFVDLEVRYSGIVFKNFPIRTSTQTPYLF